MNLQDFFKRVKSLVGYDETKEALEMIEMLNNKALEITESFYDVVHSENLLKDSALYSEFNKEFANAKLGDVATCLRDTIRRNSPIYEQVKQIYFSDDATIATENMPLRKANAMVVLSAIGEIAQSSISLIVLLMSNECGVKLDMPSDLAKAMNKKVVVLAPFIKLLSLFARNGKDVVKLMEVIPNVDLVDGNVQTLSSVHGASKVDPLRMGFVPLSWNPFHFLGMKWAAYKVVKYKSMQEDIKLFEYQVMILKEQRDGTSNPKLEKVLEIYEDKVKILYSKVKKMEE